jgi:hypothetical protein
VRLFDNKILDAAMDKLYSTFDWKLKYKVITIFIIVTIWFFFLNL